jgi:hypothetical protein
LVDRLLTEIADDLLPRRRDRCNPRVVKRKMSNFKLKRPLHAGPPKPRPVADTICIIHDR